MTSRSVVVVASEILGRPGVGGAGTADSLLAVALARHGHRVRLLRASGRAIGPLDPRWREIYASTGVDVEMLVPTADVRPSYLRPPFEVFQTLRDDPPDVVVADDWRGVGYVALRARQLGLGLERTAFVLHCHGPARVLAEFARKVPDTLARFGEQVAERASADLADAAASPSAWLLDWMQAHEWPLPERRIVIPCLLQSIALGEAPPRPPPQSRIRRLAFFGQLREGKGVRIYVEALGTLDPALLEGVQLVFVGRETKRWTTDAIATALAPAVHEHVQAIRFETELDRTSALVELRQPGTLALMPSLLDNSPNTVLECIEHGIPFVSTKTGGIPELVAEEDRARMLCEPNAADLAAMLRLALTAPEGIAPARAARDPAESLQEWLDLVESIAPKMPTRARVSAAVDVVTTKDDTEAHARRIAAAAIHATARVIRAQSRQAALAQTSSEWVLFLDEDDLPDENLLDRLVSAQQASGADVVTCAVRLAGATGAVQLFLGDAAALGLAENQYGVIALVRRSLVGREWLRPHAVDPEWVLLSRLALGGARVVSVPDPLAVHLGKPGAVTDVPGDGLAVLETFESAADHPLPDLPQLAATLAAALARTELAPPASVPHEHVAIRGLRVLREEGPRAVVRRVRRRL